MAKGDMHIKGGHAWQREGMCGKGGVCMEKGTCVARVCVMGGVHGRRGGRGTCIAGGVQGRRDCHCCGWYTSYWNAFLFED